jgi:4-nitrophenyl phosphatase
LDSAYIQREFHGRGVNVEKIQKYNYLIDLDGTIYRGKEPIQYAEEFIDYLNYNHRKFIMITNCPENSTKKIKIKLQEMGVRVKTENILTAGQATAAYLAKVKAEARVFVVGSEALKEELVLCGMQLVTEWPEFVVLGFDREFSYEKMERASHWILKGAKYICTNSDMTIPQNDDLIPHTGAMALAIQAISGVAPVYIGKPERYMLDEALWRLRCSKDQCCIIGDRIDTDVLMGTRNGVLSYLVLTGVTDMNKVKNSEICPTRVFENLRELKNFDYTGESFIIK